MIGMRTLNKQRFTFSFAFITLFVFLNGSAFAGEIMDKFYRVHKEIKGPALTEEEKTELLLENLNRAIRMSLLRSFSYCDYNNVNLTTNDIEQSDTDPFMYYVEYNEFVGFYIFTQDPKEYLQTPADEKIYLPRGVKVMTLEDPRCRKAQTNGAKNTQPTGNNGK